LPKYIKQISWEVFYVWLNANAGLSKVYIPIPSKPNIPTGQTLRPCMKFHHMPV
jgi:hypothetical protein